MSLWGPLGDTSSVRNKLILGPYKATKGTNTKVTSAQGHFCAHPTPFPFEGVSRRRCRRRILDCAEFRATPGPPRAPPKDPGPARRGPRPERRRAPEDPGQGGPGGSRDPALRVKECCEAASAPRASRGRKLSSKKCWLPRMPAQVPLVTGTARKLKSVARHCRGQMPCY